MALKDNNLLYASVTGLTAAGAISLSGARVGDVVIMQFISDYSSGSVGAGGYFESVVSVDDELQQTLHADISADTFNIFLARPVVLS